ncbi:UNVERIFIED_CONTAM: hypothetical protein GTU68_002223, partial [Idotea baltica]|nr:hypothetical protein [Idotea baltica]
MMLKFYGLYKQATEGPCHEPKPSFYEVVKGYKWRAWNTLGNMSKSEAMGSYVNELKKIVETMSYSEDVAAFIEALGPFYEYVELPNVKNSDSNHNITAKHPMLKAQEDRSDHFEVISLYNCKGSPKINGVPKTDDDDDSNEEDISGEIPNGVYSIPNGESSSSHSPHLPVNGHTNSVPNTSIENALQTNSLYSLKRLTSDTESDEEYSEPAETPELLHEKQKLTGKQKTKDQSTESPTNSSYERLTQESGSPVLEIVTCGGGDASDAGRIRLTQAYQFQQGSSRNPEGTESSPSQRPPSSRGGGGRRRRDSENPRGGGGSGEGGQGDVSN